MIGAAEIQKMTLEEKMEVMELLWRSISEKSDEVPSPAWHKEIVAARLAKIDKGEARVLTIDEARQRLRKGHQDWILKSFG